VLRVRRLGVVPYREASDLQHGLAARARDDYLLLLEHPHVYTLGVRADPAHVLCDPGSVGAELVPTDRGGDVTYHGPGQLVVYPVVTLDDDPGAAPAHVRALEQVAIDALADVGVAARRHDGYPGVWIGDDRPRKVAAVGVRAVRAPDGRRRSLHGLALNVDCDLAMFGHIVPCGISDFEVTSLREEGSEVTMREVVDAVAARAAAVWGRDGVERQDVARSARESGLDPDAGLPMRSRKPPWLRTNARIGQDFLRTSRTIHDLGLVTVCEEAGCPNIFECWADGTATFMVNGSRCTRACRFCLVDTRRPFPLDPGEPERVAQAVDRMGLAHVVITCVARDDLPDGGAGAIAATVDAVRRTRPAASVEVLVSDLKGTAAALASVVSVRPDIFNHNIETVARLQRAVRPSAGYARSLTVLARAADAGLSVKSGLMVGLGERTEEVEATLADLAAVGVSIATVGQYLRPSERHLPVARWWTPGELAALAARGRELGLAHVEASPLTRSSYHARRAAEAVGAAGACGSGALGEVGRPGVPVPVPQRVRRPSRVG
jgi:lipoic acid synthetase